MYRLFTYAVVGIYLPLFAPLFGQDTLSKLQQAAEQKTQAWESLTKSLDARIRILLPCDAKIVAAVQEASQASDTRLAAYDAYYQAMAKAAAGASQTVRSLLDRETKAGADSAEAFVDTERAETTEERAAMESQIAQLSASAARRAELAESESTLRNIAALIDRRDTIVRQQRERKENRQEALRSASAQAQAADAAIKQLVAAEESEAKAWSAYYTARIDRAKMECAAISPGVRGRAQ